MRLTKECFGHQFESKIVEGFEFLRCGQMRRKESFGHNAGWYNKFGEKIGWGDLSKEDVRSIKSALQGDELFITLGEHDSFWNFVTQVGVIGSMSSTKDEEKEPGQEYVAEHSRFIISKDGIFYHNMFGSDRKEIIIEGIKVPVLTTEEVFEMMRR